MYILAPPHAVPQVAMSNDSWAAEPIPGAFFTFTPAQERISLQPASSQPPFCLPETGHPHPQRSLRTTPVLDPSRCVISSLYRLSGPSPRPTPPPHCRPCFPTTGRCLARTPCRSPSGPPRTTPSSRTSGTPFRPHFTEIHRQRWARDRGVGKLRWTRVSP